MDAVHELQSGLNNLICIRKTVFQGAIQMEEHWYVYILLCKNHQYYVGYTSDIERRIIEHNSGKVHLQATRDQ